MAIYKKYNIGGAPMFTEDGTKIPGMKTGGSLQKMASGGYTRDPLPQANKGKIVKEAAKKAWSGLKNLFTKNKNLKGSDFDIDGKNVKNTAFLGVNRGGKNVYKFGDTGRDHIIDPADVKTVTKTFYRKYGGSKKKIKY